jgi:hypothetical protein
MVGGITEDGIQIHREEIEFGVSPKVEPPLAGEKGEIAAGVGVQEDWSGWLLRRNGWLLLVGRRRLWLRWKRLEAHSIDISPAQPPQPWRDCYGKVNDRSVGSQLAHQVIDITRRHRPFPEQRYSSQLHVGYRGLGPSRRPPLGSQNTKRQYPGIAIGRNKVSVDHKRKPIIGGPFPPNVKPAASGDPEARDRFTLDYLQIQRLPARSGAGT